MASLIEHVFLLALGAFFLAAGFNLPVLASNMRKPRFLRLYKIGGIIMILSALAQIFIGPYWAGNRAELAATYINQQATFPVKVDEITTATGVFNEGEVLVYSFSLSMNFTNEQLVGIKSSILSTQCKSDNIARLFKGGVTTLDFRYQMPDGRTIDQPITTALCQHAK